MAVLAEHNLPALSPDPNPLGLWMSTSDRVSHFDIGGVSLPHLSPGSTYQVQCTINCLKIITMECGCLVHHAHAWVFSV